MVALGLQELTSWCRKSGREGFPDRGNTYTKARRSGDRHLGRPAAGGGWQWVVVEDKDGCNSHWRDPEAPQLKRNRKVPSWFLPLHSVSQPLALPPRGAHSLCINHLEAVGGLPFALLPRTPSLSAHGFVISFPCENTSYHMSDLRPDHLEE